MDVDQLLLAAGEIRCCSGPTPGNAILLWEQMCCRRNFPLGNYFVSCPVNPFPSSYVDHK